MNSKYPFLGIHVASFGLRLPMRFLLWIINNRISRYGFGFDYAISKLFLESCDKQMMLNHIRTKLAVENNFEGADVNFESRHLLYRNFFTSYGYKIGF